MYRFSDRVTNLPNAGISDIMRYASKYDDVLSLGQGTPLFPTPSYIYEYVHAQSKTVPEIGMYSTTKLSLEETLKTHIANTMQEEYGFRPDTAEIVLTVGGVGALFSAIMSLVQKGDEVIYFDPSYPLHLSQLHMAQATPVFVPLREDDGWSMDFTALQRAITKNTRAIILTNPNNPTGTVLSEKEVRMLADIIVAHELILILDEAYSFLTYGMPVFSPLRLKHVRDRVILCRSFSKEFAMTGWRIGYAYGSTELMKKIQYVHIYFSVCPPTPSIVAATAALSDPRGKNAMDGFIREFTKSRSAICTRLDALSTLFTYHQPQGAYYVFPRYKGFDMPAMEFAKLLVDEARVITVPGGGMGPSGAGHIRMSFAANESLIHQAFDRIDAFVKKHT